MRERKKTAVHGTLEMIPLAWKFNSKQLLSKTLNSRINTIETRAVSNIEKRQKMCSGGLSGGAGNNPQVFNFRQKMNCFKHLYGLQK